MKKDQNDIDIPAIPPINRRTFLKQIVGLAAVCSSKLAEAAGGSATAISRNYLSLSAAEADFAEALVNVLCPADHLTPNGVDCGLAVYIDRQLAGGFGRGARLYMQGPWKQGKPQHGYQQPLTPEKSFKAGINPIDQEAFKRTQKVFSELSSAEANSLLQDIADDKIKDNPFPLAVWFNQLVYPLFIQACFADPVYGGNKNKVFWKMLGYPGLPAIYGTDMKVFRGRAHPGREHPQSMEDFS